MTDIKINPGQIVDPETIIPARSGPIIIGPPIVPLEQLTDHLDANIGHTATDLNLDKAVEEAKK